MGKYKPRFEFLSLTVYDCQKMNLELLEQLFNTVLVPEAVSRSNHTE
jgi:hypothetical protein